MADDKTGTPRVKVVWDDPKDLEPILVDELTFLAVNDRVYVTFGQVRFPHIEQPAPAEVVARIRPVVRLAVTTGAWTKMLDALNKSAVQLKPSGSK